MFRVITARKRSLGQGNIFRSVCQEFCPQGGHVWLPGGVCGCWGHVWLPGACVVAGECVWLPGSVCGCRGVCVVAGVCVWLWGVGVYVVVGGACMVAGVWGVHGC